MHSTIYSPLQPPYSWVQRSGKKIYQPSVKVYDIDHVFGELSPPRLLAEHGLSVGFEEEVLVAHHLEIIVLR